MAYSGAVPSASSPVNLRDYLNRRMSSMKLERTSYDAHIRDIADHMRPRRTRFTQSKTNKGDRRDNLIYDNTPLIASRVLTSGMNSGMASPARPWYRYETEDLDLMEYGPVKAWLNELESLMRRIYHASNTYNVLPIIFDELGLFGTGVGLVDDHFDKVIQLTPFTWGEYCLGLGPDRSVDTLYHEMRMTVWQTVGKFVRQRNGDMDWSKCSTMVKTAWDKSNYDMWVDVHHAIEPNPDRDASKKHAQAMPWRSIYWEPNANDKEAGSFLRRSGYRENPIIAPRWEVVGNDIYGGSCPGMNALGDARQLQIQQKRKGEAIDKMVRPPTQGGASLANRYINTLPGAHNVVADVQNGGIRPIYEVTPQLQHMIADIEDTRERIRNAFFVRDFLPISNMQGVQPKNQFELSERKAEGLLVLGPVVERLNNEMLSPLHDRAISRVFEASEAFWRMGENGMLPPPPPELSERPINVTYISTLAQVQKGIAISGVEQYAQFAAGLIAAGFTEAGLKFDAEQAMDEYADMLGLPAKIVRSDEVVQAMKKEMEQQKQAAQIQAAAPAMKDMTSAAKDLSETDVGGGRGALEAILGNMGISGGGGPQGQ